MALTEGDKAPDFSLPASNGQTISLKDFAGKKVVVFFIHGITPLAVLVKCAVSVTATLTSKMRERLYWASAATV